MDLIKKLKPHNQTLNDWKQGKVIDAHKIAPLAPIWKELAELHPEAGNPNVNLTCSSCIGDMLKGLYNWRLFYQRKVTVEFKGVPQKITKVKRTIETDVKVVNPEDLPWKELQKYAKAKGVTAKKKVDILKELKKK